MRKAAVLPLLLISASAIAEDKLTDGTEVRAPVSYKNLTLMPLVGDKIVKTPDFITLDDGMENGTVVVSELGQGGSVNELQLENRSTKALFLMAGEVVLGGQQDRIIGRDTIIPPRQKQPVSVYCVEHGRWSGKKGFHTGKALAHGKLRVQANFAGQAKVWEEVADKNQKRKTANETDTYRQIAEKKDEKDVGGYTKTLGAALAAVPGAEKMVGFAVVVNGQVVAVEQFASPALYRKLEAKLIRSYALDAVDQPVAKDAKPAAAKDVQVFLAKEKDAKEETAVDAPAAKARTQHLKARGFKGSKVMSTDGPAPVEVYKSYHAE